MLSRRDLLVTGAALVSVGAAYELKPHKRRLLLSKSEKMAAVIPESFGQWKGLTDPTLLAPDTKGKLASELYSELVERIYDDGNGGPIMMLIAYGDTQSDLLQLHRPEACYPAVGFDLKSTTPASVPLGNGAAIPSRRVVAVRGDFQENIVYWTRLGEYLPASSGQQKLARLQSAMSGVIPDGALFRCSIASPNADADFQRIDGFIRQMVGAVAPPARPALLGTKLATAFSGRMVA